MPVKTHTTVVTFTPTSSTGVQIPSGATFHGLQKYDWFVIDADLQSPTDGTLDVYLQRKIVNSNDATYVWRDWAHLPQQAAGGSSLTSYSATPSLTATAITVGTGSDGAATPALAADTYVSGHPGNTLRVVLSRGDSGTGGLVTQTIRLQCWQGRD